MGLENVLGRLKKIFFKGYKKSFREKIFGTNFFFKLRIFRNLELQWSVSEMYLWLKLFELFGKMECSLIRGRTFYSLLVTRYFLLVTRYFLLVTCHLLNWDLQWCKKYHPNFIETDPLRVNIQKYIFSIYVQIWL